jgi:hypothetical protein
MKKDIDGRRGKLNVSGDTPILMEPSRKESLKVLALNQEANPPLLMISWRIKVTIFVPSKIFEEQESNTRKVFVETLNIALLTWTWFKAIFKYIFSDR